MVLELEKIPQVTVGAQVRYTDRNGVDKLAFIVATPETAGDHHPLAEGHCDVFAISRRSGGYVRNDVPYRAEPEATERSWRAL
jgi:hypothetical protein